MNKALASLCLFAFAGLVFSAGISLIESIVVNLHHSVEQTAEQPSRTQSEQPN